MPVEEDGVEEGGETVTSRLLSFGLQISRGLEHLANNKIVHRDVAARNILLSDRKVVKISDFGLARRVGEGDVYERTRKGPLPARWMAPESLLYNEFSQSSDVWSFGVLLWEIVTLGSTPYPGLSNATLVNKIKAGGSLTCPPHSAAVVNEVMLSCWRKAPDARPTFAQLRVRLEELLEDQVNYLDLQQMDENLYSILDD
ncbi:unnamed protein product [Lymnaea stagnalis]|uniref:Protein kinase domain-containing protein n=1 Tax=Lymnaea stagnalis TaxID=6523 RepID=A0AAV2IHT2_LYMST